MKTWFFTPHLGAIKRLSGAWAVNLSITMSGLSLGIILAISSIYSFSWNVWNLCFFHISSSLVPLRICSW